MVFALDRCSQLYASNIVAVNSYASGFDKVLIGITCSITVISEKIGDGYSINNDVAHEKLPSMGYIIEDLANTDFSADERIEEYLEQDDSTEEITFEEQTEQVYISKEAATFEEQTEQVYISKEAVAFEEQTEQVYISKEAVAFEEQTEQVYISKEAACEEEMYQEILDDELFKEIQELIEDLFEEKPIEEEPILDELIIEIPDLDIVLE
ncbi:hypothetical protein AN642_01380 [Epulopiscium sp. SCG-B10WGA-EpuloA2]|nr:hypothetical protein AN642_01380 [Epulopiscium sp. SCG-B10WGA-EpuloA2]